MLQICLFFFSCDYLWNQIRSVYYKRLQCNEVQIIQNNHRRAFESQFNGFILWLATEHESQLIYSVCNINGNKTSLRRLFDQDQFRKRLLRYSSWFHTVMLPDKIKKPFITVVINEYTTSWDLVFQRLFSMWYHVIMFLNTSLLSLNRFSLYFGPGVLVRFKVEKDVWRVKRSKIVNVWITTQLNLHHPSAPTWPHLNTHIYIYDNMLKTWGQNYHEKK